MGRRADRGASAEPADILESTQDPDAQEIDWLDDVDEDEVGIRPAAASASPARRRLLGSLILVGAVLAATGRVADAAYHRDQAADLAANELILRTTTNLGVALPELALLDSGSTWTVRPSTEVEISVLNGGPDPVTLLPGATLLGEGLSSARLGGSSPTVLAPGRSTVLQGYVTADCALGQSNTDASAEASLTVSARTSGGGLGVSSVTLGSDDGSVRDRICTAENSAVATLEFEQSADVRSRSITLTFGAASQADVPLNYTAFLSYGPVAWLQVDPQLKGPAQGALAPGANASVSADLRVTDCAQAVLAVNGSADGEAEVAVDFDFSVGATHVALAGAAQDVSTLIDKICG